MPITSPIPLPGSMGEAAFGQSVSPQQMLNSFLQNKQNQERLQQQALANQQMNQYRMGSLDQQKISNEMMNKYRMGSLGIQQQGLGMRQQLQPMQLELLKAKIEDLKRGGRGNAGVGQKEETFFQDLVRKDNPNLPQDKIYEASNALREGKTELNDGTKLNPLSPASQASFDRLIKGTTTTGLVNQGVRANAAEAEMGIIDKAISKGLEPYGDTILGVSTKQISDTFNHKDKDSQNRLGDYIASEMLAMDKAALQTRIAGIESGVTIINEAMGKAKQTIKAKYPVLSNAARQRAMETLSKTLSKVMDARNKYGIGASKATNMGKTQWGYTPEKDIGSAEPGESQNKVTKWDIVDGNLVRTK